MPKDKPSWPENPYGGDELIFPGEVWQDASDTCAKAVKERDAEFIEQLETMKKEFESYSITTFHQGYIEALEDIISKRKDKP